MFPPLPSAGTVPARIQNRSSLAYYDYCGIAIAQFLCYTKINRIFKLFFVRRKDECCGKEAAVHRQSPRGQDEIARAAVRRRFDLLQGGLSGPRGGDAAARRRDRAGRALRRRFRSRRLPRRRRHAQRDGQRHHAPAAGEASAAELPARRQHERLRGKPVHFLRSRARGAERHAPSAARPGRGRVQ